MAETIDFILNNRFADLPDKVISDAVRGLTDTLGVGISASRTDLSRIIHNHAFSQFGGTAATLWQDGRKASAAGAALANGMTIDALDAHDGQKLTKGHVGCGVVAGALALHEAAGQLDAEALLTSIAMGYEIGSRAGIALHQSVTDYHTSGAWIALAVAAIGARVLNLSPDQTHEALGIAEYHGPRSQMMRCIDHPTMVKDGSGWGAMAGVSAAYLARDGFTGAPALTITESDLSGIWADLGKRWYISDQYIKLYPVCRWAQPAVEAVLNLMSDQKISAGEIAGIHIETFHEASRLTAIPTTTEQAQYSLPFPVAAAALRGDIGVREISDDGLNDPAIIALSKAVEITERDEFNAVFPAERLARAHLTLTNGRTVTSDATAARGDPELPLDDSAVSAKFLKLTSPILGEGDAQNMLNLIDGLSRGGSAAPLIQQLGQTGAERGARATKARLAEPLTS